MKGWVGLLSLWGASVGAAGPEPLVEARSVVPGLQVELRYATKDNFLGKAVYPPEARCMLRASVAQRLAQAAELLAAQGFRLKAYDCYRPRSVQWEMWRRVPQRGYVADPRYGSHHNRGAAVDVTLVTLEGQPVEMPTPFDTFGPAAHQGAQGGTQAARENRERLLAAMRAAGFIPNRMEWWHYDAPNARAFSVLDEPFTPSPSSAPAP